MDAQTIVTYLTPIIVPLILAGMKKLLPKIPSVAIPILAPILGGLVGAITAFASHNQNNIWLSVVLGLAGVGVREVVDQLKPAAATTQA